MASSLSQFFPLVHWISFPPTCFLFSLQHSSFFFLILPIFPSPLTPSLGCQCAQVSPILKNETTSHSSQHQNSFLSIIQIVSSIFYRFFRSLWLGFSPLQMLLPPESPMTSVLQISMGTFQTLPCYMTLDS